uniref:DNA-directed RNA polymerases I, II, and III subunit RPABC3 n=1 Tax=Florenciella parvula TaxID=236787 RepID=A0A7S2BWL1_9STRA|mmetsp:Transcript_2149/g.4782  ORF Transcript_2149/g.4782 Transcript_2149/m.4782 type:complete len:145 (+) Transcript_2149:85-519(+)|eukprot:CAMPEP_0119512660 /NCGR_PEP_ID=MMETSP1344-20130328/30981_1 /TAXON_ID=236787 /ORGANISM="Florenciella parvula, Strain CCMP2471" /LENGTH=144 /DNA_ID=CAMNT_0007549803 /DNA_START=62 /DNA_END=496 /DNA_ORIENTATION=-
MSQAEIFSDTFVVHAINPEKKTFDRIDRLAARAETFEMELLIDINAEVWPVAANDKISFALATTLSLNGDPDDGTYQQYEKGASLLDRYEYAMHGKVYNFNHKEGENIEIDVSFGGLLMRLSGDQRHLVGIELDQSIYCLMKKV